MREVLQDSANPSVQVVGDSMIDAAICDGDIVTVRRQDTADHGDIVASLGEDRGAVRLGEERCSSAAMRTTLARTTGVVLSLDRMSKQRLNFAHAVA
ncbi:LexA family protein [Streptomyces sp. NBC_00161]|uniref:LexA family protein n=1 Tax=Streptomyces sp. NBC_00161 TaxID=2975671 RepID=UPI00386761CA